MDRLPILPTGLFLVALLFAGCHGEDPEPDQGPIEGPEAEVTSIQVIHAPDRAAPGEDVEVCWELEGHGTIPHTALHYDNESHADPTSFDIYDAGAAFPDNETGEREDGYQVPFVYCSSFPMGNETMYYRAHAIVDAPPGVLGEERTVEPDS